MEDFQKHLLLWLLFSGGDCGRCATLTYSGSLTCTFSPPRCPNPARGARPQLELPQQRFNQPLGALFLTTDNNSQMDKVRDAAFQNSNNRGKIFTLNTLTVGGNLVYLFTFKGRKACRDIKVFIWQVCSV